MDNKIFITLNFVVVHGSKISRKGFQRLKILLVYYIPAELLSITMALIVFKLIRFSWTELVQM